MILEYKEELTFTEQLEIVDPGNMCIRATSKNGFEYYLVTKTVFGKTLMLQFGPVLADVKEACPGLVVTLTKIDYNEGKIAAAANKVINNPKANIEKAEEITDYEAFCAFPDVVESFKNMEADF